MAKGHKRYKRKCREGRRTESVLLTSVLRLRCLPPVPYDTIVNLILRHWPAEEPQKLLQKPDDEIGTDSEVRESLERFLKRVYEDAESKGNGAWLDATEWDEASICDILEIAGLEGGYQVLSTQEIKLQLEWKRNGDWREGSIPDEPEIEYFRDGRVKKVIRPLTQPSIGSTSSLEMPQGLSPSTEFSTQKLQALVNLLKFSKPPQSKAHNPKNKKSATASKLPPEVNIKASETSQPSSMRTEKNQVKGKALSHAIIECLTSPTEIKSYKFRKQSKEIDGVQAMIPSEKPQSPFEDMKVGLYMDTGHSSTMATFGRQEATTMIPLKVWDSISYAFETFTE
ncbi:hypothetical protein B7494_g5002 [Chlorociboria aeruginascens]|nr:hypothetical protein B7494_g5002 [Chlorociboria aeruginascens]